MAGDHEASSLTQGILFCAGLSAGLLLLWVLSVVGRTLLAVVRAATPKPAASKAKKDAAAAKGPAPSNGPAQQAPKQRGPDLKTLIRESQNAKKSAHTKEDMAAHHALFLTSLKGHTDAINGVAWSPDGRLLASACDDLNVRVFDLHDVTAANPKFRSVRTQQTPLACGFGNNPNDVVAVLRDIADQPRIALFTPSKAKGAPAHVVTFEEQWQAPKAIDQEPLLEAFIVPAGQCGAAGGIAVLLSCKKFGRVFDLAGGRRLATFEPNSLGNHALSVAAGGKFFAVASFTAEVKVWEVEWGREGFKGVRRAMDLKGHSRKVMSVAISPDSTRAATASEDGTLRVWKLDVRYALQEDPKTLLSVPLSSLGLKEGQVFDKLAWGPDGTIAGVAGSHVHFVEAASGQLLEKLHAHDGPVAAAAWAPALVDVGGGRRAAALATCSSDRRVRVWRSPAAGEA